MNINSLELIKDLIKEDLLFLDKTNMKQANINKYKEFKDKYLELNDKVLLAFKNDDEAYSLKWEYARISASLDFYLKFLNGSRQILDYQINLIKEHIEDILNTLTPTNYEEKNKELEELKSFYQDTLSNALSSFTIKELLSEINYTIYKYKLNDLVYDDTKDTSSFLKFVLEDIEQVLNDEAIEENIKKRLQKYLVDVNIILPKINEVILLINIANNHEKIKDNELDKRLNVTIYKESDIKADYVEPGEEIKELAKEKAFNKKIGYENALEEFLDYPLNAKEYIAEYIISLNAPRENFAAFLNILEFLKTKGFNDFIYLFKALFVRYKSEGLDILMMFDKYPYERDCTVIAYKDKIWSHNLTHYIMRSNNDYLIKWIVIERNDNFFDYDFIDFLVKNNKTNTLELLVNSNNKTIKLEYIKVLLDNNKDVSYLVEKLDYETLVYLSIEYKKKVVDYIKDENIKDKITENIYLVLDHTFLRYDYIGDKYDAYYQSKNSQYGIDIEKIIDNYADARLDWEHMIFIADKEKDYDLKNKICIALYLNQKDLFWELNKKLNLVNPVFAKRIIEEVPSSVADFMSYLNRHDILEVPMDIFCDAYETKMQEEGFSLNDTITKILGSNSDNKDKALFLLYIANKGLITNEILMYYTSFFRDFYILGINNSKDKYLKASFLSKIIANDKLFKDYNLLFLTDKELMEIKEDKKVSEEVKDLRLRKYYWDLIKLIENVPENIKKQIVVYIAKSNLKEHINYIKTNYPAYLDILIENISDIEINSELLKDYENNMIGRK